MARKEHNIHYIYKTTCNITGRWYVGMHSTSNENDGYLGSGTVLRRSIRKYGADNHTKEILSYHNTREALILKEIEIITSEFIQDELCINLKCGGTGGFSSDEHMLKCSKAGNIAFKEKLFNDKEFLAKVSKNHSEINKKLHSDGKMRPINKTYDWNGKSHSEETKTLMSELKKGQGTGETNSQYGTCWITKEGVSKKIKKEDLEQYLLDNWNKGRR
jgi:hypothetical protein